MSLRLVSRAALALACRRAASAARADPPPRRSKRDGFSEGFAAVAEKVSPSVVQIEVTVREPTPQGDPLVQESSGIGEAPIQRGMGSGVIFSSDGAILTNNHVVEDALTITVRLRDGRFLPARLVGRDPATDLALMRGRRQEPGAGRSSPTATRCASASGSSPSGRPSASGYTVTTGVRQRQRSRRVGVNSVEDYLQTDASINPGNSGGPLVNLDGQVLGINTMIVGRGQGIGFAVPLEPGAAHRRPTRQDRARAARLDRRRHSGTSPPSSRPSSRVAPGAGALVNSVAADGPGARAQLEARATSWPPVDGKKVRDAQEFIRELLAHDVGETVLLEVIRGGKHYGAKVELVARAVRRASSRSLRPRAAGRPASASPSAIHARASGAARHAAAPFRGGGASARRGRPAIARVSAPAMSSSKPTGCVEPNADQVESGQPRRAHALAPAPSRSRVLRGSSPLAHGACVAASLAARHTPIRGARSAAGPTRQLTLSAFSCATTSRRFRPRTAASRR